MSRMTKTSKKIEDIASKHLGQSGGYSDQYDPSLLVKIPRALNREAYGLTGKEFVGVDTWNAYEVSAITRKGQPVAGMLKIVYPASSECHVESKSLKLYLNSFNMTKLGNTASECVQEVETRVKRDLDALLETDTTVKFFGSLDAASPSGFDGYKDLDFLTDLDALDFTEFKSDANQLEESSHSDGEIRITSNLLRSNCRITNQPDWGDVYIYVRGPELPSSESLAKYIVSHRTVSHFHEEICEMMYAHLLERFQPEKLMVACLYTRRGGVDINPIRASHKDLIPEFFTNSECTIAKTLRQ